MFINNEFTAVFKWQWRSPGVSDMTGTAYLPLLLY